MPFGPAEIAIIVGVALLIFGPKKLPELGKALGQGLGNFKKSLQDAQDEVKNAARIEPRSEDSSTSTASASTAAADNPKNSSG